MRTAVQIWCRPTAALDGSPAEPIAVALELVLGLSDRS
jgi:hypothetical protein